MVGYLPTYLVTVQGVEPASAGAMLTVVLAAYVLGSLTLPALSDRLGLRRSVYIPGVVLSGMMILASAQLVGWSLVAVLALWGVAAGGIALIFVVPLELASVGPALAGSAVGATLSARPRRDSPLFVKTTTADRETPPGWLRALGCSGQLT